MKNAAAVKLSKLGASKGGIARAAKLSPRKRKMIARKAAKARWDKARKEMGMNHRYKSLTSGRSNVGRYKQLTVISKITDKLRDNEYRTAFVASQINVGVPFQIRALMKAHGWTQAQLAQKTGMLQPRISELMTPGRTRPNIETLRRVAEAYDCALIVRFAPFGELARWSEEFDPESFNVPSFAEDPAFKVGRR